MDKLYVCHSVGNDFHKILQSLVFTILLAIPLGICISSAEMSSRNEGIGRMAAPSGRTEEVNRPRRRVSAVFDTHQACDWHRSQRRWCTTCSAVFPRETRPSQRTSTLPNAAIPARDDSARSGIASSRQAFFYMRSFSSMLNFWRAALSSLSKCWPTLIASFIHAGIKFRQFNGDIDWRRNRVVGARQCASV